MTLPPIHTIDDVITQLDLIIEQSKTNKSPLGYFAALYRKVTIKVKEGIADNYFDDGPRMEQLDIVFAKRYLDAYTAIQNKETPSESWVKVFDLAGNYWPIVLQHLLIGINAHINLDLGIAAAEISKGKDINNLKGDFDKINEVLSDLVDEVQVELSKIWPTLAKILKWTGKVDDFMIDFSMKLAREGAWKFANEVHSAEPNEMAEVIATRDQKIAKNVRVIFPRNILIRLVVGFIRIREKGNVAQKIEILE